MILPTIRLSLFSTCFSILEPSSYLKKIEFIKFFVSFDSKEKANALGEDKILLISLKHLSIFDEGYFESVYIYRKSCSPSSLLTLGTNVR